MAVWHQRLDLLRPTGAVALAFTLVLVATVGTICPLSAGMLDVVSPAADRFMRVFDVAYATGSAKLRTLSIDPSRTFRALVSLMVMGLWAAHCAVMFRRVAVLLTFVRYLSALGAVVAVVGLAQKAMFNGKLLWFWTPEFYAWNAFGPFVNRNHFAGWMLLALCVSSGYLLALLHRGRTPTYVTWRKRVLHLGSPDAQPIALAALAILMMAVSLVWTMSRSGIAGGTIAMTLLMSVAMCRIRRSSGRVVTASCFAALTVGAMSWRGTQALTAWYADTSTLEWRFTLWRDSLPALEDFWLTGSGLNTYGTLMLLYPRSDITVQPREAHSDYLQLAIEGGLLIGIPVLLLAFATARDTVRRLRQPQDEMTWWIRMGAAAGICGILVQELTEFSLQIPGVALLFATCVGIAIHEPTFRTVAQPRQSKRIENCPLVTSI
jgi:hypothetical protein